MNSATIDVNTPVKEAPTPPSPPGDVAIDQRRGAPPVEYPKQSGFKRLWNRVTGRNGQEKIASTPSSNGNGEHSLNNFVTEGAEGSTLRMALRGSGAERELERGATQTAKPSFWEYYAPAAPHSSHSAVGERGAISASHAASGAARQAEQEGITFIESASQRVTRGREALNRAGNAVAETVGTAARGTVRQASRAWNFSKRGVGGAIGWTKGKLGKGALWTAGGLAVATAAYAAASAYFGARAERRMTRERVQADQERAMQQEMAAQQAAMEETAMAQQAAAQQQTLMGQPLVTDGPHGNRVLMGRGQMPAAAQATEAAVNPPVETAGISAIDNKPVEQLNSPLRQ